jgi:ribonuclease P protein component
MSSRKSFSLGKQERLKSRKQIDILFGTGKKITQFPFRILYRAEPGKGEIKAGFTVSSKNFPRAVDRNRVKRMCREAYRLQKKELEAVVMENKELLHLFFIYTDREILSSEEISSRIEQVLNKLLRILHEKPSANP